MTWLVPSYYLNKCWNIVNWTLGNKFQWNINRNLYIFIQENAFKNVVWKMAVILFRPQCVKVLNSISQKVVKRALSWPLFLECKFTHNRRFIKWKHFPRYWPFVRWINRSSVNFHHKGQWRGALRFSLICAWTNGWANNWDAGDLRHHRAHYDVTVMQFFSHLKTDS